MTALSWAAARSAEAHCGDECWNPLPLWLGPTSSEIAADGVLAFSPGYARAERALEFFTLKVHDAMGEEVAGTFEVHPDFSVFVWRPAQPWSAGATYTVVTHIDTAAWASAEYSAPPGACITYDQETQVTIAAEPLPAPAAPPLVVTSEHVVETWDALEDLVCCDGAYPELRQVQGHCPGAIRIAWSTIRDSARTDASTGSSRWCTTSTARRWERRLRATSRVGCSGRTSSRGSGCRRTCRRPAACASRRSTWPAARCSSTSAATATTWPARSGRSTSIRRRR
ncbi:hypothetical protein [Nannocystis pusilla]|uniref:hypothetical protein n=1 Tax=Nannocystis pusilla TaxID=889268 RepID=UPI003B78ED3B